MRWPFSPTNSSPDNELQHPTLVMLVFMDRFTAIGIVSLLLAQIFQHPLYITCQVNFVKRLLGLENRSVKNRLSVTFRKLIVFFIISQLSSFNFNNYSTVYEFK